MARGSGRPTIIDIAKQAGVSFKTVSRVLNGNPHVAEELRDRVLKAAAALNYRPNLAARSLVGTRSYTLALLMEADLVGMDTEDDWYIPSFLSDLQFASVVACQKAGYRLSIEICEASHPSALLPPTITKDEIDGIIVSPPLCDRIEIIEALDASGIPYVLIAPGLSLDHGMSVATDEYGGGKAMTEHLLGLGHRRIGFISGPDSHFAAIARMKAYSDVMKAHGLEPLIERGNFIMNAGYDAALKMLSLPEPPTAIFCANDDMAAGAIGAAMQRRIRVPDQLSIAGFDDSIVARINSPALTTIRQSFGAMATLAVHMLATASTDPRTEPQHIVLPAKLIERGSTAGPAH